MDYAAIILVILVYAGFALVLPIVAIVLSVKASRRVRDLQSRMELLRHELRRPREPAAVSERPLVRDGAPAPEADAPGTVHPSEPAPVPEPPAAGEVTVEEPAPAEEPPPPPIRPPSHKPGTIEEKIGMVWFLRIGALLVLIGLAFFFKWAVDNDWIGPWGRVAVGVVAGMLFLGLGEYLARKGKTHQVFVQGILGLGLALLLVSAYASFAFYHLLPVMVAFGVVAVLALFGGVLAIHHRAESILVLSLLAVYLNPVLLSTGVDRAFALFTYLIIMTSGALVVAIKYQYRVATWTAIAGITVLFAGWYERFFDVSPPPPAGTFDAPPEELQGAYHLLGSRWAPLLYAALFPIQWTLAGLWSRLRGMRRTPVALYLAAAVGAHAAYAALLFDRPILLGVAMCILGIGFAVLLTREGRANWLGLPMAASFVVLISLTGEIETRQLMPMMILTGGWSAIYFGFFFRRAYRENLLSSRNALLLLGGAGLGLAVLSTLWMIPDHFNVLGVLLTLLSAGYLVLALAARSVITVVAAFLLSLAGLGTSGAAAYTELPDLQVAFLIISGVWALVYIGFLCVDMFVRGSPWSWERLAVLAGAGAGFGAIFLSTTPQEAHTLRALLALASGGVYLAIGLRMLKAGDYGASRSLVPLGLALAFFTLSVALLFTGVTVTVIWATEAVVLSYLARAGRQRGWFLGALILFGIATVRMFALDFFWLDEQIGLFVASLGSEGSLVPVAFLHPRAWALGALGAGLLLSGWFASHQRDDGFFRTSALGCSVAGHLAVLALLITESCLLFTSYPGAPPPAGLPSEEFFAMLQPFEQVSYDQAPRLAVVATVVLGLYAAVLLVVGFAVRNRLHRFLGIGLFGITLGKLALVDIWDLERVYQIVVLVSVGLLLLVGGYLYARFGKRLRSLLANGGTLIGLVILLVALPAGATDAAAYAQARIIEGVQEPGDYRLEVDPDLYGASLGDPVLTDMRILDSEGSEVPYLRRRAVRPIPAREVEAEIVDPVALPDGGSRAVLDLGDDVPRHRAVVLDIPGSDFLRATRVESSPDGKEWGILSEGAYVFDVATGGPRAVRRRIAYPSSDARWLRITLLPGSDRQKLPIRSARILTGERPRLEGSSGFVQLEFTSAGQPEKGRTLYEFSALPPRVPVRSLLLGIANASFVRQAAVEGSTRKHAWFPVGGGVVYRIKADEYLRLGIEPGTRPHLRIWFEDGDNPPLDLQSVRATYPVEEIVFRTSRAGPHRLLVGHREARPPAYDLGEILRREGAPQARNASLGPLRPNSARRADAAQEDSAPWSERHALVIQVAIGAVVLLLLIWTLRLIQKGRRRK